MDFSAQSVLDCTGIQGEIEGWFQDPSTWALVLKLKPDMFMMPLRIVLEEFQGKPHAEYAPTWLVRLHNMPDKYGGLG